MRWPPPLPHTHNVTSPSEVISGKVPLRAVLETIRVSKEPRSDSELGSVPLNPTLSDRRLLGECTREYTETPVSLTSPGRCENLFLSTYSRTRFGVAMAAGTVPSSSLELRNRNRHDGRKGVGAGIVPLKLLPCSRISSMSGSVNNELGMAPLSWLELRSSSTSFVSCPHDSGMVPCPTCAGQQVASQPRATAAHTRSDRTSSAFCCTYSVVRVPLRADQASGSVPVKPLFPRSKSTSAVLCNAGSGPSKFWTGDTAATNQPTMRYKLCDHVGDSTVLAPHARTLSNIDSVLSEGIASNKPGGSNPVNDVPPIEKETSFVKLASCSGMLPVMSLSCSRLHARRETTILSAARTHPGHAQAVHCATLP